MYQFWKRIIDLCASACGLVILSPFLLVLAIVIATWMGRPVLFWQRRSGLHGSPFLMIKFRTMRDAKDLRGDPLPDSERLTALGRLLRSTSIDELPELWNVLRGDMSLVGPRPLLPEYDQLYSQEQRRRMDVPPGITGLAQVRGRNLLSWEEKFAMDVQYVEHASLRLDLRILAETVGIVLRRQGVSEQGAATASRFTGSAGAEGDRR